MYTEKWDRKQPEKTIFASIDAMGTNTQTKESL